MIQIDELTTDHICKGCMKNDARDSIHATYHHRTGITLHNAKVPLCEPCLIELKRALEERIDWTDGNKVGP